MRDTGGQYLFAWPDSPALAAIERGYACCQSSAITSAAVCGVEQAGGDTSRVKARGQIDFQIAAGSLPGLFRNAAQDFPVHNGYLRADRAQVDEWRRRLDAHTSKLKVGVAWRGGMTSTRRKQRSLELSQWSPILKTDRAVFVSPQHDAGAEEVAEVAARESVALLHFPEVAADLDKAAALISALDLVITVCGSVVHLSGGLGRPVWVMVPAGEGAKRATVLARLWDAFGAAGLARDGAVVALGGGSAMDVGKTIAGIA